MKWKEWAKYTWLKKTPEKTPSGTETSSYKVHHIPLHQDRLSLDAIGGDGALMATVPTSIRTTAREGGPVFILKINKCKTAAEGYSLRCLFKREGSQERRKRLMRPML